MDNTTIKTVSFNETLSVTWGDALTITTPDGKEIARFEIVSVETESVVIRVIDSKKPLLLRLSYSA